MTTTAESGAPWTDASTPSVPKGETRVAEAEVKVGGARRWWFAYDRWMAVAAATTTDDEFVFG